MNYDPRLAPVVGDNLEIDLIELGRIEQKHRCDPESMTKTERDVHAAACALEGAGRLMHAASDAYCAHLDATVREHGGTIVRERVRHGHVVERTVERYPARPRGRTAPRTRARGHRPGATRRTASSSTTSSADPPDAESEPPRRRGHLRHINAAVVAFVRLGCAR